MKKITILALLLIAGTAWSQEVSGYQFTESTESYSLGSGISSAAAGDDGTDNDLPIGFNFKFGVADYTTYSISVNGWIRLGNGIGGNSYINVISNDNADNVPLIAAFWDDHNRGNGLIQHSLTGTSPNRVLEIVWHNISLNSAGNINPMTGSFKMRLYETTSVIEFVYASVMDSLNLPSASIGLNDGTSFLSVSPGAIAVASSATANNSINSTEQIVGRKYTFTPLLQCAGTPDPGNTISSDDVTCAGHNIVLSLENEPEEFGISYQWQQSLDGVAYTNILGAESSTATLTQSEPHYYKCIVSCGTNAGESIPVLVGQVSEALCVCFPYYTFGKTDGDLISNVTITGTSLSNNTGDEHINPYYTYFTGAPNLTATLQPGNVYTLNVTVGSYAQQYMAVWIDYNDDNNFTASERIGFTHEETGSNGTASFPIVLDCSAPAGVHRMRIRDVWNTESESITACDNFGYGETEDYDITIVPVTECQPPNNLTAAVVNSSSAAISWVTFCGQNSWEANVAAAGSGVPTETPNYPDATSGMIVSGLSPETAYEFYVRADCDDFGISAWAGPFTFTTLPAGVVNDDCIGATPVLTGGYFAQYPVIATNVNATKSLGEQNVTCGAFAFGGDVWFRALVPDSGTLTIEVAADPGSPVSDTAMAAYTGVCGSLTQIGCNDDQGINSFSRLNLTGLSPGAFIYARVWEYANDTYGTFQFSAWDASLATKSFYASGFSYFPNPVKDVLNLSYIKDISSVEVFNLLGQKLISARPDSKQPRVDLSNLSSGQYLVRLSSGDEIQSLKIIKQ